MRRVLAYIEADAGMADDHSTAAWAFDLDLWGRCGQGPDEDSALAALSIDIGHQVLPVVVEHITGDEQAFQRDLQPATDSERAVTLAILSAARQETLALVTSSPPEVLDFDDPTRILPAWAGWRTLRRMAWHLADTESSYYLPSLGASSRPAESDLITELSASARHVQAVVSATSSRPLTDGRCTGHQAVDGDGDGPQAPHRRTYGRATWTGVTGGGRPSRCRR